MSVYPVVAELMIPAHAKPDDPIEPLVGWAYLTEWTFPWWMVLSLTLMAGLYLYGVHILRRRGDHWSIWRTVSFVVLGLGNVAIASFSFLGAYDTVLFWTHAIQHMVLTMIAPVFLVSGAPITLALRVLPKRPRSWLLRFVHSWFAKAVLFPPFTLGLMVATPFMLYLTGWYDLTLRVDFHHDVLHIYMVTIGILFFLPLLGPDPQPYNLPYPVRVIMFILTMPFHAFLGVMIMGSEELIAEEWYLAFERSWGLNPLEDQSWAGGLMWATGDITMLAAMIVIFVRWVGDARREAKRVDRDLDRQEARAQAAHAAQQRARLGRDAREP